MPPSPADFIHARACKLKCEKILTRPFQNEDSKCLRVPHSILSAKKQENFSDFLLSKAVKI